MSVSRLLVTPVRPLLVINIFVAQIASNTLAKLSRFVNSVAEKKDIMGYAWYMLLVAIAVGVTECAQDAILQEIEELQTRIR